MEYKHPKIKVAGIGVSGITVVNQIMGSNTQDIQFVKADTDAKYLDIFIVPISTQIVDDVKVGLYAGSAHRLGHSMDMIKETLEDSGLVFIVAAIGFDTNIEASSIMAKICRDAGVFNVAIVTWPFSEDREVVHKADAGLHKLLGIVDTVIIIPNDRIARLLPGKPEKADVFKTANQIIHQCIKGISDLVLSKYLVGMDIGDVRSMISGRGGAAVGFGQAKGENRAVKAIEMALTHPLLEHVCIADAKSIILSIAASENIALEEMTAGSGRIYNEIGEHKDMILGVPIDNSLEDYMRVMIIATGIDVSCYVQGRA